MVISQVTARMQAWEVINKYMPFIWFKVSKEGRIREVKKGMAGRKKYLESKPKWCLRDVLNIEQRFLI